jgi:tetratricopeptide (TPR) repeat protein
MKTPIIGTIGTANAYGLFLAIAIVAAIIEFINQKSRCKKILLFSGILLMFGVILLNGSRGALLGFVSAGIIILLFIIFNEENIFQNNKIFVQFLAPVLKGLKNKNITGIIIVIFLLIYLVGFGLFLFKLNPESSAGRLMVWKISAPMITDHPLFGVGHGRFGVEYLYYQARFFENPENLHLAYKAANLKQAHNEYFQAFCESGIPGGFLFLSIWVFALWSIYRHIRKNINLKTEYYGLAAILLTILVHATIDTPLHVIPISVITYIVLGLVPMSFFPYLIKIKLRIISCIVLILLSVYGGFILYKAVKQYPAYIEWKKGYEIKEKSNWASALYHYKAALKSLPQKGNLLFHLGGAMNMMGDFETGKALLKESLKNHTDKNIYLSLARVCVKLKDYNEAEKYALTVLSMFPDHLLPHLLLGEIYYYQGKILESKESLRRCINRQTRIKSNDVLFVAYAAENLWKKYYGNK